MIHESEALLEYSDFYDYSASYPADTPLDDYRIVEDVNSQLILPSGARIGKRSLMRYFRYRKINEIYVNKLTKIYQYQYVSCISY